MLVKLARDVGPSVEAWLDRPFAWALYVFRHLEELDALDDWVARIRRIEAGMLTHFAFSNAKELEREQQRAIADAGPVQDTDEVLETGRRIAREIESGRVLED